MGLQVIRENSASLGDQTFKLRAGLGELLREPTEFPILEIFIARFNAKG